MTKGEDACKRLIDQHYEALDGPVGDEEYHKRLYLLTMAAYIAGATDALAPAPGHNTLFQVDDGGAVYWVAARTPERAVEIVKKVEDRDNEDDPCIDYPMDESMARRLTFRFESGGTTSLWNAFELCREFEQIISCSEWP